MPIRGTPPKAATYGGLPADHVQMFFANAAAAVANCIALCPLLLFGLFFVPSVSGTLHCDVLLGRSCCASAGT